MYRSILLLVSLCLILFLLPGCVSVMKTTEPMGNPASDQVIVNFIQSRAGSFIGGGGSCGLWDGETFVGESYLGSIVQHKTTPGKHIFIADAENFSYLSSDLKAGKTYYVLVRTFIGVLGSRVAFDPVQKGDEAEIDEWMKSYNYFAVDEANVSKYIDSKLPDIKEAIKSFNDGKVEFEKLNPEDFR